MSFQRIAENKIQEAMEQGLFDNIKGKGRPIDLDEYFATPPEFRLAHSVLKNAKVVPAELELIGEIEALKKELEECADEAAQAQLKKLRDEKTLRLNLLIERRKLRKRG